MPLQNHGMEQQYILFHLDVILHVEDQIKYLRLLPKFLHDEEKVKLKE